MKENAKKALYTNVHAVCGMKLEGEEAIKAIEAQEENPCKVDFRLICELQNENLCMSLGEIIGLLEMSDIPMTDAVRKLGICSGILFA